MCVRDSTSVHRPARPLLECPCESSEEYMGAITHVCVVYFLKVITVPKVCIIIMRLFSLNERGVSESLESALSQGWSLLVSSSSSVVLAPEDLVPRVGRLPVSYLYCTNFVSKFFPFFCDT